MTAQPERIPERELLAYRIEFRNSLFRQIHRRLRHMKGRGFTQKEMAKRLNMAESQLSRLLKGQRDLRLETLSDLARALGCRIRSSLESLESQKSTFEVDIQVVVEPIQAAPFSARMSASQQAAELHFTST